MTDTQALCAHTNVKYSAQSGFICKRCEASVELPSKKGFPMLDASTHPTSAGAQGAIEITAREKRWDKDIPAYTRLRKNGFQPKGIDGSADLELRATTRYEIESGDIRDGQTKDIAEAVDIISETTGTNPLTPMTTPYAQAVQ